MKIFAAALLVSALAAAPAFARSPIDGTWKADLHSAQLPQKPDVFAIQSGTYTCSSCTPAIRVPADGRLHPVSGHPYYDMISIRVADPRTVVMTQAKAGKQVFRLTETVGGGGNRLSYSFRDMTAPRLVTGSGTETRVARGPAGAHLISGSWRNASMDSVSDSGLIVSFRTVGDTLNMSTPTGQSYAARIDGGDVPIHGDSAGTVASVQRLGPASFRETDKRGGKVVAVVTMTVAGDGRTMNAVFEDKLQNTRTTYKAYRQ